MSQFSPTEDDGMEWWLGVDQCWPMGAECTVDWDAWSLLVGFLALLAAAAGVLVTTISAAAVFWLGFQANSVARVAHEIDRSAREREGNFLLVYLNSELLDAYSSIEAWVAHETQIKEVFLRLNQDERRKLLEIFSTIQLPKAEELFGRLHVLEPSIGRRLARVLGTIKMLKIAEGPLLRLQDDEEGRTRLHGVLGYMRTLAEDLKQVHAAASNASMPIV